MTTQTAINQITQMLSMQDAMNSRVSETWRDNNYEWYRAIWVECAEMLDHHGWKWWKHQEYDLLQLQMELIDIWHFILSEVILRHDGDLQQSCDTLLQNLNAEDATDLIEFDTKSYVLAELNLVAKLELLIGISAARRIELGLFEAILADCKLNWDNLFRQYVGKNVLNFFRQDNGYKEGTYQKIWNGKEDNEHLVEVLDLLDAQDDKFQDHLYNALSERY